MSDKLKAVEAIKKLTEEQAEKVLIFVAGLEAGQRMSNTQSEVDADEQCQQVSLHTTD